MDADPGFAGVPIERVREFWDRAPCNIRHSNKTLPREYCEVERRRFRRAAHPGVRGLPALGGLALRLAAASAPTPRTSRARRARDRRRAVGGVGAPRGSACRCRLADRVTIRGQRQALRRFCRDSRSIWCMVRCRPSFRIRAGS
jgi:hypothetical protein